MSEVAAPAGLALAARGLLLRYRELVAVDADRLDVAPGTLVGLAGPSGSGKSTLLYLLSGLVRPDAGETRWDGEDIASLGEAGRDRWRRRHAGFVFQNFHLIDEMSPEDNVLVGGWFERWSVRGLRPRAKALLERFDVPRRRRVALLSRGEQQRVALARAMLFDPPVVFADEPTASLDQDAGRLVAATLRGLAGEGRTVIAASHDRDILDACDRVVRLEHGRVAA